LGAAVCKLDPLVLSFGMFSSKLESLIVSYQKMNEGEF